MLKDRDVATDAWRTRFRAPKIVMSQAARGAPDRGIAATNTTDTFQLYAWEVPTGSLRQLTHQPQGVLLGYISPDGRWVYYFDDAQGNEIGHFVRVPFEGGDPEDITPDLPPYASWSLGLSGSGNRLGLVAADQAGFHLYVIDVREDGSLSEPRLLHEWQTLTIGPAFSHDGSIVVVGSTERSQKPEFSLVGLDTASGEQVAELWDGPDTSIDAMTMVFPPVGGDTRLLSASNKTGTDVLLIWDAHSGKRTDLAPEGVEGSARAFDWSHDGTRILFRTFNQAVQRFYSYDVSQGHLTALHHPSGTYSSPYFMPNGEIFVHHEDATHPVELIALDGETGAKRRTVLAAGAVPPGHPWRSVSFSSSDGERIQGWLCVPEGRGPFPTILETHGGPESVQAESFVPQAQAWVDHGFAYLTINYRGSITFGRDFQQKIWGQPGYWEIEDMAAARDWLVKEGIAHPDQIFLTGWSYGGYLTLQGLGTRPELWAGGMAGVAIADWTLSYEDSAETLRAYQAAFFGGAPDEKPEQYTKSSPITYAEQVRAPVLIVQGRNDTRTPARPIEAYEEKMRSLGKDIEVRWFDTGHLGPFAQIEEGIEHQEIMLDFARRILGQGGQ